jgi:hypothetical protein
VSPLQRLKAEFLSKTKAVRYVPGLQAQRIGPDGTILIGNRVGSLTRDTDLVHEMCHLVEIDDARMRLHGWGLHYPTVVVAGQVCQEPTTMKMVARELRVIAYQANILAYIGATVSVRHLVSSMKFMPDFFYVPLEDGRNKWEAKDIAYRDKDASQLRWCKNRVETLRAEFTTDRFLSEWNRKIALLEAPP